MSQEYKDKIDKLCKEADKGSGKAMQELLNEADYWSNKIKEIREERDKNNNNK